MANGHTRLPHLLVAGTATTERYTSPMSGGGRLRLPQRERQTHGAHLLRQLDTAARRCEELGEERRALGVDVGPGICLQFESDPGFDLKFDSLEYLRSGIELLSVRVVDGKTIAAVYVPEGKIAHFITVMEQYLAENTPKGNPKNRLLVESISAIRIAALEAFWTDSYDRLPAPGEAIWWEIWLRAGEAPERAYESFRQDAPRVGLQLAPGKIRFPDRTVLLARGDREQMAHSAELLNTVAELRRAKDTPELFTEMRPWEQAEWVDEARDRIRPPTRADAPAVCLLDTGVNRGHPLLEPALSEEDMQACHREWGTYDHHGHGTEMAGLAAFGDLVELFAGAEPGQLEHRLESVKILPPVGDNDPKLYGALTIEAVARAEVTAPHRARVGCLTVTADSRDRGQPSSWSAAVDKLTAGADDDVRRLLIVSAGNTDPSSHNLYPESNRADCIQDPGQAWNALTVGAFTEKDYLDPVKYPDWSPVAPCGGLSPSSCTSSAWTGPWPIKPEIVVEGGNLGFDPGSGLAGEVDSLSLLTTYWRPDEKLLSTTGETSAAAAQAARMAAILQAAYPEYWPETIRALLVHSARWTPAMLDQCRPLETRGHKEALLKFCGFGVPALGRALWSASNSLTLVAQSSLQPYDRIDGSYKTRDMHLHAIPWPTEVLRDLGETPVKMRVTLSYFIEPNPGRRGWKYRHRYMSHGLRFKVKTAYETPDQFRERINAAAREEEGRQRSQGDEEDWFLGPDLRGRGSVHSDWWEGTAADLAQRDRIGVYPVIGWWRERHQLGRWERLARYSLVVTIETPAVEMNVYTPVMIQVEAAIPVET